MNKDNMCATPLEHRLKQIDPEELEILRRGTGRTTAMLARVFRRVTQPETFPQLVGGFAGCLIVADNAEHRDSLNRQYSDFFGHVPNRFDVAFVIASHLGRDNFVVCPGGQTAQRRGDRRKYVVFYDHATLHQLKREVRAGISSLEKELDRLEKLGGHNG